MKRERGHLSKLVQRQWQNRSVVVSHEATPTAMFLSTTSHHTAVFNGHTNTGTVAKGSMAFKGENGIFCGKADVFCPQPQSLSYNLPVYLLNRYSFIPLHI